MDRILQKVWALEEIRRVPHVYDAPGFEEDGVKAVFYENMPWHGKETRAFAWYGFPEHASEKNPVPGIVLVHGGGGTALADWCRVWIDQGFAVIAMDNCGGVPAWCQSPHFRREWPRHEYSGPAGWGNLAQSGEEPCEQWMYHAVSSVLRAKELLASFPQVQKDNISINGISWGAVITCITIGLDSSFRSAVSVYGCGGFRTEESSIVSKSPASDEQRKRFFELWDPDLYLPETTVPAFFLAGTGDISFPTGAWERSVKGLSGGRSFRSLRPDYPHNHSISWQSKTLNKFVRCCSEGKSLPEFVSVTRSGNTVSGVFRSNGNPIRAVCCYYTRAEGAWMDRRWNVMEAQIQGDSLTAELPPLVTNCYFGIEDDEGCLWTSELI